MIKVYKSVLTRYSTMPFVAGSGVRVPIDPRDPNYSSVTHSLNSINKWRAESCRIRRLFLLHMVIGGGRRRGEGDMLIRRESERESESERDGDMEKENMCVCGGGDEGRGKVGMKREREY